MCVCVVEKSLHAGPLLSGSTAVLKAWGVCRGQKGLLAHNKEKSYTNTHTAHTSAKKKKIQAHKDTHRHNNTHTHVQPCGPDQYMTRVNLLRTSGRPIKELGVLIENHRSQGETNNDVNPQQQHNGPTSLGLWEWR